MADAGTTPVRPNSFEMEADVNVEFNEASSRQQINSGESVKTLFGKIRKFLTDLKAVAFSGSYSDLSGVPDLTQYATKAGLDTKAEKALYGDTTINVGRKSGTAVGVRSTAEGSNTTASGICSHAESGETTASGDFSHAEGLQTTAAQSYTHTEGYNTSSNAPAAHAEGYSSIAAGQASHAEGQGTQAVGNNSHSGGYGAISYNNSSFSHGIYTIANKDGEIAFGKYNKSNDDTLFSIGDGTSETARHNAFEITTTGGKLHNKDIATTNDIPNLSAYAKTADVPNIKVNAAVNSDTVGGKEPEKIFFDNGLTSDLDSATKSGCYAASPDTLNAPLSSWWVVDTMNYNGQFIVQKAHMIGSASTTVSYIRNYANGAWSDWTEIYTAGNKPYVTGVVTISGANDTDNLFRIETNHGFAPSWALCCNIADNIVYCCALSSDNPTRFIYLRSTEAIKNGDIFEYIIFR